MFCACEFHTTKIGNGGKGDRTHGLMLAKHTFYQLNYTPPEYQTEKSEEMGFEPMVQ